MSKDERRRREAQEKLAWASLGLWGIAGPTPVQPLTAKAVMTAQEFAVTSFQQTARVVYGQLEALIREVKANAISPAALRSAMEDILGPAYERMALYGKVAAGRARALSGADLLEVDRQWSSEQSFVDGLAKDLELGRASADKIAQRIIMYGHGLREVYNRSWVAHLPPGTVFNWFMHPGAQHCPACTKAYFGSGAGLKRGQYRANELPFIPGRSPVCLDNCMCWLITEDGRESAPQIREPAGGGD